MSRKRSALKSVDRPINLSLPFAEDAHRYGTAHDIYNCAGAEVVLDTETTGLEWWSDKLVGLAVHCPERDLRVFIPTLDDHDRGEVKHAVRSIARMADTRVGFHNNKFDSHFLDVENWKMAWQVDDTAIMSHLYDSRQFKSLGDLERRWLGTNTKHTTRGDSAEVHTMPMPVMAEYGSNDARITAEVRDILKPMLTELALDRLYRKDIQYSGLLQRIERGGMMLNREFTQRAYTRFTANLKAQEAELFSKIPGGRRFNWRSDQELSYALYEWYGWERPKNPFANKEGEDKSKFAIKGKYNKYATSSFLLMEKSGHPLGGLVQDMRETDKLRAEVEEWERLVDSHDMLHGSFNETGTRTGRLSCRRPNMQNVPAEFRTRETQSVYSGGSIRQEEYNLRLALVARPGYTLVSIDHRQQEMRLFAIMAQVPEMLEALRNREDIHTLIANLVWADDIRKDPSVLPVRREWSKTVGFGLLYGMTPGSLRYRLNKTPEEGAAIIKVYYDRFPRIPTYLEEVIQECGKENMLRYWSGRIWREDDPTFYYRGVNALVQGGAADIISIGLLRAQEYLDSLPGNGRVCSIIHDEGLFEVPTGMVRQVAPELQTIMEVGDLFDIPFATDVKVGQSYGSMMKLEKWEGA